MIFSKNKAVEACRREKKKYAGQLGNKSRLSNKDAIIQQYESIFGRRPDLEHPVRFTEKIQWVKLFYNDPLYARCADKYRAREYAGQKGLGHILNDLIGVYESAAEIDFDTLPERFVIKATHGSGWNFICKDKSEIRPLWRDYCTLFDQWLAEDFSIESRELHYTHITPRLICERFLEQEDGSEIKDFKFFCFDGEVKLIQVDYDRFSNHRRNYYTPQWDLTDIRWWYERFPEADDRPANLPEMLDMARKLSEDFFHARIDLYTVNEKIYFGEITLTDGSGLVKLTPEGTDEMMGAWMTLPFDSKYVIK